MIKHPARGSAFALVVILLALMMLMVAGLNQFILSQQRVTSNAHDVELARNYARLALLDAEQAVLDFDSLAGMESPGVITGSVSLARLRYDNIIGKNGGSYNLANFGQTCNSGQGMLRQGWCYLANDAVTYNSRLSWQPWLLTSNNAQKPCNSYSASGAIPLIDDAQGHYTKVYTTGDSVICANPRYMLEPINLDFRGRYALGASGQELGQISQSNQSTLISYRQAPGHANYDLSSARLYRITLRAFGKSGDTRVTLQEYLAVVGNTNQRVIGDGVNQVPHQILIIATKWLD